MQQQMKTEKAQLPLEPTCDEIVDSDRADYYCQELCALQKCKSAKVLMNTTV